MAGPRAPAYPHPRLAKNMARPNQKSVNFLSYNSTGLSSLKTQWIRDLTETCSANFIGIQEHFKRARSLNNFFRKEFPNFDSFVLPAYREEGRDTGRAQGGLAQLCGKAFGGVKKEKVVTGSWRLQAEILHFGDFRLLWANVYFPCDPRILNFDEGELLEVQSELRKVLDNGGYDGCLCAGDFNYDARRTSGFAKSMSRFLEDVGLVSVWEKFEIDFTHIHTDHKTTSILDNFYVNSMLLPYVEDAGPLHLGDNPSGHSPILLKLRVGDIPQRPQGEGDVRLPRRIAWHKAETGQLKEYCEVLTRKLGNLEVPESLKCCDVKCKDERCSQERDSFVVDVVASWIEASYRCLPVTQKSPSKVDGKQRRLVLPGWKEKCEPLRKDAKFWYAVWISAGRPSTGELHKLMVCTRVKFRSAVRKIKCEANSAKAFSFLAAAESGDQALLKEMRRVVGSRRQVQELPDCLEGAVGESEVLEKFRSLYEALYNSAGTQMKLDDLLVTMNSMIDCRSEGEVRKITAAEVAKACRRMRTGKIDVSQGYSSDVFSHAPPLLCQLLAAVFRSFLVHGTITVSILACSFMPLLKSARKDATKFDSWRAVAGASQLLKLFEYVLLNIWGHHLESDTLQFGFKPGTGTDQCTWLLHAVAEHYLHRGSPTLCCLLDVRKGFPSVRFGDLFEICLLKKKLPAVVCRVLVFMYKEQSGFIFLKGRRSPAFSLSNGMREGAACSPILWAVYADGLLVVLRGSGLGCKVAGLWVGGVLYADDLALLAPTRAILASMLALVESYGASLNLTFSHSKSFCIYFVGLKSNRKVIYPVRLQLNGVELPWKESAVHLGHTLHQDLTFKADARVRRASFIASSVEVRNEFAFAAPAQILKAVRILCCSAYGAVLWRLNSAEASSFFKAYSSCVRRIWRLPLDTFTYLVEGHLSLGLPPLRNMVLSRYPTFYQHLLSSPCPEVSVAAELLSKDARSTTAENLSYVSATTGLDCSTADKLSIKAALPIEGVPESERWRLGLLDSLLSERDALEKEGQDVKRVVSMLSSLCNT